MELTLIEDKSPETKPPGSIRYRTRIIIGLMVLLILVAVLLAIGSGRVQLEKVVSASMEPTLLIGDEILSDANAMPQRYDIVCLSSPEDPQEKLVKRIIGVPGDVITIQDGIIYLNGREEYSEAITENKVNWDDMRIKVPTDSVFVLGDNRNNSRDSLDFGCVPYKNIRGVVVRIIWPLSRLGTPRALH